MKCERQPCTCGEPAATPATIHGVHNKRLMMRALSNSAVRLHHGGNLGKVGLLPAADATHYLSYVSLTHHHLEILSVVPA